MPTFDHVEDHSTLAGAQRLASRIKSYWQGRGYSRVDVDVVQVQCPSSYHPPGKNARVFFGIKSNIVDGYPPTTANQTYS